jgi:hypothetical protein
VIDFIAIEAIKMRFIQVIGAAAYPFRPEIEMRMKLIGIHQINTENPKLSNSIIRRTNNKMSAG